MTDTAESANKAADEDLLSLFDQYSDLMSSNSDWLFKDIDVVINETLSEGISAECSITVQQCTTTVLFDTDANMSVMSQEGFQLITIKAEISKNKCMHSNISQWHWFRTNRTVLSNIHTIQI